METTVLSRDYIWGCIGDMWGVYRDNGKENGFECLGSEMFRV